MLLIEEALVRQLKLLASVPVPLDCLLENLEALVVRDVILVDTREKLVESVV